MPSSNIRQLKYLIILRMIAIFGQLTVLIIVNYGLKINVPLIPILLVNLVLFTINILSIFRIFFANFQVNQLEFFIQLLVDVISLSIVIYYTGGSSNPFISFFILQVIIAATILRPLLLWQLVIITIICYTILIYYHIPIEYLNHYHIGNYFDLHMHGMWISFIMISILVAYFVVKLSTILKERDAELALSRERIIKDEHVVTLGAVAASTAHELGTPLATIAILTSELALEYNKNPETLDKLGIIKSQIERCKNCLSHLSLSIGEIRAEGGKSLPVDIYIKSIIDNIQQLSGNIHIRFKCCDLRPVPIIITDKIIEHAIINPLINAIQSARKFIDFYLNWNDQQLYIIIEDDGEGIDDNIMKFIGTPTFTTKPGGKGLGIFLTETIISKLGGNFILKNRDDARGACSKITLPLDNFRVNS
jgi:two-component system sensor histidine kinase RegB